MTGTLIRNNEVEYDSHRVQRQRNIIAIDVRNVIAVNIAIDVRNARMPCLFFHRKATCDAFMYFSFLWNFDLGGLDSICGGVD